MDLKSATNSNYSLPNEEKTIYHMKIPAPARFQIKPLVAFNWLESVTD